MHELRVTLRRLSRAPGFTAAVVLTLGLGVGVTTGVFSVAHTVVLAPLPFAQPDRLVRIVNHPEGNLATSFEASHPDFVTWRETSRSFEDVAGYASSSGGHLVDFGGGALEQARGEMVSWNLFSVLGQRPLLGRELVPEDDVPGAEPVVVISERLWRQRLGADPGVLGRVLEVDGTRRTVVAVMPGGFEYPLGARLWLPVATAVPENLLQSQAKFFNLLARLDDDVSAAQAQDELNAVLDTTTNPQVPASARTEITLAPLADELIGDTRGPLLFLLGAALLVLLLATANTLNLQVVRSIASQRDHLVRAALGAGLRHRIRQAVLESAVLALLGGGLGLAIAWWAVHRLLPLAPITFFRGEDVGLHLPVLIFALAVTVGSLLLSGVVPVLLTARRDLAPALQGAAARTTGGRGSRRLLAASVVAQVALALMLTFGAALLVRSFLHLSTVDTGFAREGVLTLSVPLLSDEYGDPARAHELYEQLTERVAALPGVEAAAGVLVRPLEGPNGFDVPFTIEGRPQDEQAGYPLLNLEAITSDYFRVMGLGLFAGRGLARTDDATAPRVVVISRALAKRYWPGESPVGRRIKWGGPESPNPWLEIVGVVHEARYRRMEEVSLDVYVPHQQMSWALNHLVVRTQGNPMAVAGAVRGAVRDLDPRLETTDVATTAQMVSRAVARPRFNALLLGLFAALALVLGAVGLYGLLSYVVALRRREIGIRMALGAVPNQVAGMTLRHAVLLTAMGIGLGLVGCLWLTRTLSSLLAELLFQAPATDLGTLLTVPWVLLAVAVASALVPALRAGRVDPGVVLRGE